MAINFRRKKASHHIDSSYAYLGDLSQKIKSQSIWNKKTIVGTIIVVFSLGYATRLFLHRDVEVIAFLLIISTFIGGIIFITSLFKMKEKRKINRSNIHMNKETTISSENANPPKKQKLFRSVKNSRILGVCGGIAEYFGISATVLRIILILLVIVSYSGLLILYFIIGLFVLEKNPDQLAEKQTVSSQ